MDCSLASVHGILQARILEWVAISFSRGSSPPRDQTQVSHIEGRVFTTWATREAPSNLHYLPIHSTKPLPTKQQLIQMSSTPMTSTKYDLNIGILHSLKRYCPALTLCQVQSLVCSFTDEWTSFHLQRVFCVVENDDYAGNWMMIEWDEGTEEVHLTSTKGFHVQKQERDMIRFVF